MSNSVEQNEAHTQVNPETTQPLAPEPAGLSSQNLKNSRSTQPPLKNSAAVDDHYLTPQPKPVNTILGKNFHPLPKPLAPRHTNADRAGAAIEP